MALPNLTINIENGNLGRSAQTSDGVAGLIGTRSSNSKLKINTVYVLSSLKDFDALGATEQLDPLIYRDVAEFYRKAGSGAVLYLYAAESIVKRDGENITVSVREPIDALMAASKGTIRLIGICGWTPDKTTGFDPASLKLAEEIQAVAEDYAAQVRPFRAFVPAYVFGDLTDRDEAPRGCSFNRVAMVMACDKQIGTNYFPAIGQVLGTAASLPVHYSLGRVKNGMASLTGTLTNGKTPEESQALLDQLDAEGYIIYRSFVGRSGYYFNDDPMAAPVEDDYSNLNLGRVIDKAIILTYNAYIGEILDSVEVDENGNIPAAMCSYYEGLIERSVGNNMKGEISSFTAYIDPAQDLLSSSKMVVNCRIVPKGVLREISVNLGFQNPSNNQ